MNRLRSRRQMQPALLPNSLKEEKEEERRIGDAVALVGLVMAL